VVRVITLGRQAREWEREVRGKGGRRLQLHKFHISRYDLSKTCAVSESVLQRVAGLVHPLLGPRTSGSIRKKKRKLQSLLTQDKFQRRLGQEF
jgi:hypothetical protein